MSGTICKCLTALTVILAAGASAAVAQTASPGHAAGKGEISKLPAAPELDWPLPPGVDRKYDAIDGKRMTGYVEELVAIARKTRDAGDKLWGRFAGTPSGEESQAWVIDKFKEIGLDYRVESYPLPTQYVPRDWSVSVSAGGETVALPTAYPYIYFERHMPAPTGTLELDAVWAGLGMESDFHGKDVRGKAVFVYSIPTPSSMIQSAAWMGAAERAQKLGAKALVVVIAIPGNLKNVSHLQGAQFAPELKLPIFTVGLKDGEQVEALNARADGAMKARLNWQVDVVEGMKAANVIGVLPGQTDENIFMLAHTDGYFEGAADNAAGSAALIETAAFFARQPREQRRRTMYFVATPDHHSGAGGAKWVHDNMQPLLAKTAVFLNAEHVAAMQPVMDRPWGAPVPPDLMPSNQLSASWWGVNGSDRLANIIIKSFATYGVPTQIHPGGSAGELRAVQFDAPSFYLHNKNIFYHTDADTTAIVPASGLRTAVQAFATIFDEINKLELSELRPPAPAATR